MKTLLNRWPDLAAGAVRLLTIAVIIDAVIAAAGGAT